MGRADATAVATGGGHGTLAVAPGARAGLIAGLALRSERRRTLVVTATMVDAERLAQDLSCFLGTAPGADATNDPVVVLPPWDTLPLERVSPDAETMGRRSAVRWRLTQDQAEPLVVVAPVRALLQRLAPWGDEQPISIRRGQHLDLEELLTQLVAFGYRREHQVEHRGEFSVRGGIVDVFSATAELPVRIDLFGDEVDRLSSFDPTDQRSRAALEELVCFPCREVRPDEQMRSRAAAIAPKAGHGSGLLEKLAEGQLVDGMEGWLSFFCDSDTLLTDQLGDDAQVVLVEPRSIRDRAAELNDEERSLVEVLVGTWELGAVLEAEGVDLQLHLGFDRLLERCDASVLSLLATPDAPSTAVLEISSLAPVAGDGARLAEQVTELLNRSCSVTVCGSTEAGTKRLAQVLVEHGLEPTERPEATGKGLEVVHAPITAGFIARGLKVALLAESEITGRRIPHKAIRQRPRPVDGFFDDLAIGSYVVHRQHGVAKFSGVTTRTMLGTTRDYLILEFKGADRLYLPTDQIDVITPYSGGESPSLSKMGGAEWTRARSKARAAAAEVAAELVALYRERLVAKGHAFGPDTPWQAEVEGLFPYTETPDQLAAINDVKADMEAETPMDRLICADVGFGKTEIALRAVFKAIQDNKQAAVLVPTTLLASQHFQTFTERLSGYPVRVELLSRFLTDAGAKAVIDGLADGSIDVVVGTHRLLAQGLQFKDLGLLVVDEEQRFGVTHKEAIKQLATGVDVLTLSASPIPRTLEMALTGIRDLSMVTTPPTERRPILTYVGEYDDAAVREAIRRELLREGQVFFVHNRVADIEAKARQLQNLVPEARIVIAHGQMDEGSLEKVVLDFWERRYDVLLCTTIIESGIDMPSVNTLICDRADLLGLGQLHQLRGRVGRGGQRAYAYLFHPADKVLSETAYERLRTIGEHTELGSGFKIAMRDLEIRGAGNLLGSDQSGHVAAVGYDLYVQLVAEAVAAAKGEPVKSVEVVTIDVPGEASLPASYVAAEDARLEAYRRLAKATDHQGVDDVEAEWLDRFGPLPVAARGLLDLGHLRAECFRLGITDVAVTLARPGGARTSSAKLEPVSLGVTAQVRLRRLAPGATYKEDLGQLFLPLTSTTGVASSLAQLLAELQPAEG